MLISALIISLCGCNTITVENGITGAINQPQKPTGPSTDEAVDLGLSVKWAPYNVGAIKATDYGNYYAYGETAPKNTYSQSNYTSPTSQNGHGNIIYTTNDAATKTWGEGWRMPSKEEIDELSSKCKWTEEVVDGVRGCRIKGPNGNSIFIPASGIYANDKLYDLNLKGYYRHGSLDSLTCKYFNIPVNGVYGCSVRPVQAELALQNNTIKVPETEEAIDLGLSVKWAPYNIGANNPNESGNYYAYGETGHKLIYSKNNYNTSNGVNPDSSIVYSTKDVATQLWNDDWRMPTADEVIELMNECDIKQSSIGLNATADNGNTLLLPAAGYAEEYSTYYKNERGYYRNGSSESVSRTYFNFEGNPHIGGTVRPVLSLKGEQKGEIAVPAANQAIDLGLSVKWAPYNVGANNATEYGFLYAFGETETKSTYTEKNYTAPSEFNIDNTIYGTVYDVATQKWGKEWRMPTNEEVEELLSTCEITITDKGLTAKSPNGNSIFLPAAGYADGIKRNKGEFGGYYRTASNTDSELTYFNVNGKDYVGASIRPVLHDPYVQEEVISVPDKSAAIDLGLSVNWAPFNVGASNPCEVGNYYAYGETEIKEVYNSENYTEVTGAISGTSSDVAVVKWGNGWRMPTEDEILEMWQKCKWGEIEKNGVWGAIITGMNGNTIFLPHSGYFRGFGITNQRLKGYYLNGSSNSLNIRGFNIPENFVGAVVRPVIDKDPGDTPTIENPLITLRFTKPGNQDYHRYESDGILIREIKMESEFKMDFNESFKDSSIVEYGIILYKNDKEIKTIKNEHYNYLALDCKEEDFNYYFIDGQYMATLAKTYKYKCWYVKKDDAGNLHKIVVEKMFPMDMQYNKQPDFSIVLEQYKQTPLENGRIDTEERLKIKITGGLFMQTFDKIRVSCEISDINDASTIVFTEPLKGNPNYVLDNGYGLIGFGSYLPGEYTGYRIVFYESTIIKGNEQVKKISNPLLYDFTEGVVKVSTPNIPGWPERVNFNYESR